jgi:hypothetical protein
MAAPDLTSGQVMDSSAALLNDTSKSIYTYTKQLPYLNRALSELQEFFELNEVPVTATRSAVLPVDAGVSFIGYAPTPPIVGVTYLPNDLIEPSVVWERQRNTDPFTMMTKRNVLPEYMSGVDIPQFLYYVWESQEIRFFPANQDNDLKLDYIKYLFVPFTNVAGTDQVNVDNADSFLSYRTAALCAEFIGENKTRADDLNAFAGLAMDRVIGIGAKGRQAINTRHRPFRSSYKRRIYQ